LLRPAHPALTLDFKTAGNARLVRTSYGAQRAIRDEMLRKCDDDSERARTQARYDEGHRASFAGFGSPGVAENLLNRMH
jgi:hypothetical protein